MIVLRRATKTIRGLEHLCYEDLEKLTLSPDISDCVSRVVTEQGTFPTASLAAWMAAFPCHMVSALDNNPEHSQFNITGMEVVI